MKVVLSLAVAWLMLAGLPARAQNPDDQYVGIYATIQQGDALHDSGQVSAAIGRYLDAQAALKKLQTAYPDWNPKVVNFRLNYLAAKLATARARIPAAPAPVPVIATKSSPAAPAPAAAPSQELLDELRALREQVGQLQADKSLLDAKLKEALAAQPAALDPRELTKAEDRIKTLEKENDLLKVSLEQERVRKPFASTNEFARLKQQLEDANTKLAEQKEKSDLLTLERTALQQRLENLSKAPASTAELEQAKQALAEASKKLAEQTGQNRQLALEKDELQTRVRTMRADADAAAALRAENDLLKKQLVGLQAPAAKPDNSRDLQQARAQIATLQSDLEILRLEKTALENSVKTMSKATTSSVADAPPATTADIQRLRQLERESRALQRKLDAATKELAGRKSKAAAARMQEMTAQLATLRARLEMLEARQIPYSAEELAFMKAPAPRLAAATPKAAPTASRKSVKDLPAGTATLVAEAQRSFAARQYDKAEEKYLQVLRQDDRNIITLANLAVIQMEMNHLDDAEKNARQAATLAPDDAYSHSVLGQIKLRQQKLDDALDELSRAAQLNPQNAEIQNFLGITLSHKGLRGPAETALRKAIQLDPNYGSAHNNLAVIYLNQSPPMVELARWHYQKALAAGHPQNAELEKALNAKEAPAGQP